MTRIGIIGVGHVGKAMIDLFSPQVEIVTFDCKTGLDYPEDDLARCDAAVVCVDTPMAESGACDTQKVFDAVSRLPTRRLLLKSTVSPGTTDSLIRSTNKEICFSPEYIGESDYYNSFGRNGEIALPFVVLGGEAPIRGWFLDLLLPILGPTKKFFQCTALEAEIIKYMENAYLATKVSFVTEFRRICEAFDADWHTVREGWLLDPRVERAHTAAFAEAPGFAGKCLPKDLSAIIHASCGIGYTPALLMEVLRSNERFRGDDAVT